MGKDGARRWIASERRKNEKILFRSERYVSESRAGAHKYLGKNRNELQKLDTS